MKNQFGALLPEPNTELTVDVYDQNGVKAYVSTPGGGVYVPAYEQTLDVVEEALRHALTSVAKIKALMKSVKEPETIF
jgi:hypothetical protein